MTHTATKIKYSTGGFMQGARDYRGVSISRQHRRVKNGEWQTIKRGEWVITTGVTHVGNCSYVSEQRFSTLRAATQWIDSQKESIMNRKH